MKLTNKSIYEYGQKLSVFQNCNINLPVRINFFLQKNIQTIISAVEEIDMARLQIGATYGVLDKQSNSYSILSENIEVVNKELEDLFFLEQDLNLHIFKLSDFDGIELTYQQMSAIMFMVEED